MNICDLEKIPVANGAAEEIRLANVIERIPMWRHEEVLREWNRVLKPGGLVSGTTPNADGVMRRYARGEMPLQDVLSSLFGSGIDEAHQNYMAFSKETLVDLLGRYGFEQFDFSESPGPANEPHWLAWTCRKTT